MDKDKNRRLLRVGQSVHNELSLMLLTDTKDPALRDVTITGVKMAQDLTRAKVFYSLLQSENKKRVQRSLSRAAAYFQGKVGQALQLRHTPILQFVFDETPEKSARINDIVNETKLDRQKENQTLSVEQQLAKRISEADSILLCCHQKPDGDALGSVLAMNSILAMQGKKCTVFIPDVVADNLAFLPGLDEISKTLEEDYVPSLTIMLDTAAKGQLPQVIFDRLEAQRLGHVAVIDHHGQHEAFGHTVVRRHVCATGQLLFDLVGELVWPMNDDAAECMYTAISADTGSFRYSNTTQATFETAAQLMKYNVSPSKVSKALFDTYTLSRQRILGKVADTLEIECEGKAAYLTCTQKMLQETGATPNDLEGFVNIGRNVVGVEVAVLFTETESGSKASLRSNDQVDVAAVAAQFGGGGHRAAAGVTFNKTKIEDAQPQLKAAISKIFLGA